jgi:hypothetical protein
MDWVKVCHQLDDEWWSRKYKADFGQRGSDSDHHRLVCDIAFMLRDCLFVGLSDEDKERFNRERAARKDE